jgi:hypothetical protein
VKNIMEAILRLHGQQGTVGKPRESMVASLLRHPAKLTATLTAFAAAENAINAAVSTERSEAFKMKFNFTKSGERPRAMAPDDKDGIQAEVSPLIVAAVNHALAEDNWSVSQDRTADFVRVVTSPELHEEAA